MLFASSGLFPRFLTTERYKYVASDHDIPNLLLVTVTVAIFVLVISLLISFPTAMLCFIVALKFVSPTQMVFKIKWSS
jgi:ABC-type spermidine/putrescine transport system permease subunit I